MAGGRVTTPDISYRVSGSGPPLYMIHGIGSRQGTWDGVVPALEPHFSCVRYDLRGHGGSPGTESTLSLEQLVADLEMLRAHLGHETIHVMGHSLGGMIGPAYARTYPDRVMSVGLLSTAAGRTEPDRLKLQAIGDAMAERGVVPAIQTFVDRWFTDGFIAGNPGLVDRRISQIRNTPEPVFLGVFRIYATTEMGPWLKEIRCPCLVLTGELDGGCPPRLNRFISSRLPRARFVVLEGVKHAILLECPERVVPHVRDFLLDVEHQRFADEPTSTEDGIGESPAT